MINDGKVNLLLVDDHPENLLALKAIIEQSDYNLISASSGEEALIYLLKYEFAVILLDVQMPGIDGFETAQIIKARERTKNIPIIFISANNLDSRHIFTGYSVGAIDYILKPFDPFILKSKVESFVEMYRMNQKLIKQTDILIEKTKELENAYKEMSSMASELRDSEALASVISDISIDSMIIIDKDGLIIKVNPAVKKMFNYDEAEILGKSIYSVFSCEESQSYIKNIVETISNIEDILGYDNLKEVNATRKDGTSFSAEIQIGKRYVKRKSIVACTIRDVTKKKQDQALITHMAYYDGLTNLPNRRLFNDQLNLKLNQAKQDNQPLAMMYLDMDRFKYVNDSLGHLMGDRLLQEISRRLVESVHEEDFVARIGGDEFNIICSDTNRKSASEVAEHILEAFKHPFHIDNYELFITTSIGISIFPYDGEDPLVLIKNSDAALYRAKEQGKNKFKLFHSGMNIQSYRTFILQNDLRKAIERQELTLVYQPRINIETGMITSAEALLRWNHPGWGTISPSEFIPLAEETGQIVEIGEWVLRSACEQNKTWQESGLSPIRIAVNFSPQQFLQKDLTDIISNILIETGISPNMLEVEITESTIMENEASITNVLDQLRKMNINISIDDFGMGYSSLNYLRRFPVNTLKIDKSFIQDISIKSPDSIAFISSIVLLAHSLNMSVIAKGVETEEQWSVLKKQNCKEIQGYLFCPPVPPKEFEVFLLENVPDKIKSNLKKELYNNHQVLHAPAYKDQNQAILNTALYRIKELYSISSREIEVFALIVEGLSNKEISDQLFISEHTVKNHITHILQKLNVTDRLQAMAKIYQTCMEESHKLRAQ